MRNKLKNLVGCVALVAAFVTGFTGCASEREPIDRVQPNYIKKDYLNGDWHLGRTVVAVPGSDSFTFVGDGAWELHKVKFDIQENWIYARRQTELIIHGDDLDRRETDGE